MNKNSPQSRLLNQKFIAKCLTSGGYSCCDDGFVYRYKNGEKRILPPEITKMGYQRVRLSMGGVSFRAFLHVVVFVYFYGEYDPNKQLNHIDGDKLNCSLDNLELVTPSQNTVHALKIGLRKNNFKTKENHHHAKLNQVDVAGIRTKYNSGKHTQIELGKMYNVSNVLISYIVRNKIWKAV